MHWIADFLFFGQMLQGWGEVQSLGRYLGEYCPNWANIWCEFGDGSSCGRECNTEIVLWHSGKTTPLFTQAID